MKHSVLLAILMACVLCVGDVAAGDRVQRSRSRQVQKVVVEKEKVVIKKEVAQPVLLLQQKGYYHAPQAVIVQPAQAYYRVERFSSGYGYGAQAFSSGYGCAPQAVTGYSSSGSARLRALESEVEQLKIQRLEAERQKLKEP
jgi:hypothetical protein